MPWLRGITTISISQPAIPAIHDALFNREGRVLNVCDLGPTPVMFSTRKNAAGTVVPQLDASYTYDGIGNRLTSNSPVLGNHTYTPNNRNQYASITTGGGRTAVGRAPAAWTVQVAGTTASRIGEIYYRDLTATNTTVPVWQSVITKRDSGTPTTTNSFWYAKTPTVPTYDLDGNLTNDGRWVYT